MCLVLRRTADDNAPGRRAECAAGEVPEETVAEAGRGTPGWGPGTAGV